MRNRKYVLDLTDLQYKRVKKHWKEHLLHGFVWFAGSLIVAFIYAVIFQSLFGSPREKALTQKIEDLKLEYSLMGRQLDNSLSILHKLKISDEHSYRPILDMDSVSESYRTGGYGGTDRFSDLKGYKNSDLLIDYRSRIEKLKNLAEVQKESFSSIAERSAEWRRELDHLPCISPVDVRFAMGDGFHWRKVHPVLGTSRMHPGQDIPVPPGTRVYATGDGKVVTSGWIGGFGNCVVIDHGYGLQTTYGHLHRMNVVPEMKG